MTLPVNRAMLASQLARQNSTKIDYFPEKIGTHGLLMVFNQYVFNRPGSRNLLRFGTDQLNGIQESNGAILLPMPNSLIDNTGLVITRENLINTFGAETAAASAASMAQGTVSSDFSTMMSNIFYSNDMSGTDALYLARRLFGENFLLGPIGQGVGAAINPKASLLFQGVHLKEFQFEWELAPSEPKESESIRRIIGKLKSNSLPWYNPETAFTVSMFRYPSTVDMYFLGVDPNYYFYFKTAMISNMTANYTPHGLSIVRGGRPSSVNLSISLQEMDIHTANDYQLTDSAQQIVDETAAANEAINDNPGIVVPDYFSP